MVRPDSKRMRGRQRILTHRSTLNASESAQRILANERQAGREGKGTQFGIFNPKPANPLPDFRFTHSDPIVFQIRIIRGVSFSIEF